MFLNDNQTDIDVAQLNQSIQEVIYVLYKTSLFHCFFLISGELSCLYFSCSGLGFN